jgi:hypothetical protein
MANWDFLLSSPFAHMFWGPDIIGDLGTDCYALAVIAERRVKGMPGSGRIAIAWITMHRGLCRNTAYPQSFDSAG